MATVDDFLSQLKTGITAQLGTVTYATDPSSDDIPVASGATVVQISAIPALRAGAIDANTLHTALAVLVRVHHSLNWPSETLESYMLGNAELLATYLANPLSYGALASVYQVLEEEIEGPAEIKLVGLVASFTTKAQVVLAP